jgi:hypothetical protein
VKNNDNGENAMMKMHLWRWFLGAAGRRPLVGARRTEMTPLTMSEALLLPLYRLGFGSMSAKMSLSSLSHRFDTAKSS